MIHRRKWDEKPRTARQEVHRADEAVRVEIGQTRRALSANGPVVADLVGPERSNCLFLRAEVLGVCLLVRTDAAVPLEYVLASVSVDLEVSIAADEYA
jgi:hypothetical protein